MRLSYSGICSVLASCLLLSACSDDNPLTSTGSCLRDIGGLISCEELTDQLDAVLDEAKSQCSDTSTPAGTWSDGACVRTDMLGSCAIQEPAPLTIIFRPNHTTETATATCTEANGTFSGV